MRALVVLNPRSGSLAGLGIDRVRQQIAASCKANNLDTTIAVVPGAGSRLAIRAVLGRLEPDRDFTQITLESVEISLRRRRVRVALDGESLVFRPPLRYRIRPRALRVIVPEAVSS